MSVIEILQGFAEHLIGIMAFVCGAALCLRVIAHRANKMNQAYFNTFARSVVKHLEEEETNKSRVDDVDIWLENLLNRIKEHLPGRSLRFKASRGNVRSENLHDYADGTQSVIIAMKQQADALKSPQQPNFAELADRVLNQDTKWRSIFGFLPMDGLNRFLDILPNLFVIAGIFGTFVGITSSLPLIASIDITNLSQASPILNDFVTHVAYSMKASISGIAFSVIITVTTAIFPLNTVRDDVAKNFERAIEFMWYRIHGSKLSYAENALIQTLQAMNGQMIQILSEIRDQLKAGGSSDNVKSFKKGA